MTMLCKERIVLDGVTKAANLLSQIVSAIIHVMETLSNLTILHSVVVELKWAWVDVRVLPLPNVLLSLEHLELLASQINRL